MFLLPFSAFFSDTYFTYLVHRAFNLRYTELFPTSAQSFFPPVHRSFSLGAQSFYPRCTGLFPSCAQSFSHRCTELFPSGAQSFLPPVHRAFTGTQSFFPRHRAFTLRHTRLITPATSKPPHDTQSFFPPVHRALGAKACHPDRAVGEWRDLVLAFGKARQTLLFAK